VLEDTTELVRTCKACQFFKQQIHWPAQALNTIPLSWPFATWGINILGPFPRTRGGYRFLIVAIDTFTKWVQENTVIFLRSIVMHFGVPHRILLDNDTQFTSKKFENFCERHAIKHSQSSVYHPMINGQVKHANGIIQQGIKTHIFDRLSTYNKKWIEELPIVLWVVHTTTNRAMGETPFFLVYGAKVVLPPKFD
jgi:membrane-bound metal-dependent hydrolase YbcI (DUF457 family)